MNIRKLIERKMAFLIEKGYLYKKCGEKRLYWTYVYSKDSFSIYFNHDWRDEFLDITFKEHTNILLQTSYDSLVIDCLNWENENFSERLKNVYAQQRTTWSLSDKQIESLVELYAEFICKTLET